MKSIFFVTLSLLLAGNAFAGEHESGWPPLRYFRELYRRFESGTGAKTEFTLEVQPRTDDKGNSIPVSSADVEATRQGLEKRAKQWAGPVSVSVKEGNILKITLPGTDPAMVRQSLTERGKLEFRLVDANKEDLEQSKKGMELVKYVPLPMMDSKSAGHMGPPGPGTMLVERFAELNGSHVNRAFAYQDPTKGWAISLEFTPDGAKLFDQVAERGYQRQLAIVVDGVVISAPVLQTTHFGGRAEISGKFTASGALNLASAMQNPLPNPVKVLSQTAMSATFGAFTFQVFIGLIVAVVGLFLWSIIIVCRLVAKRGAKQETID